MAILKFRKLTRAQFDALDTHDLNTRYTVEEPDSTLVEYIGDRPVSGGGITNIDYINVHNQDTSEMQKIKIICSRRTNWL